jgi:hypothetical protein
MKLESLHEERAFATNEDDIDDLYPDRVHAHMDW